jgi:PKD repeat protein
MKNTKPAVILPLFFLLSSCYQEEAVPVSVDFSVTVEDGDRSVPVRISLSNRTTGADSYLWTFEGGEPSTADTHNPGTVVFRSAGTHVIRLEAWNDDARNVKEFILPLDSALTVGFDVEIPVNVIAPAEVYVTGAGRGASSWLWTFAGGEPSSSQSATPPPVLYRRAGEYVITLQVSNGSEQLALSKTVSVLPPMSIGFEVEPSFDNLDMEAPWTGTLRNTTLSGLSCTWSVPGGTVADPHAEQTQVHFEYPGTYAIALEVQNGKETQTAEKTIVIRPNTNLYTETGVKLGCSTAHSTIGCFYSCSLRSTVREGDMINSPPVDLVFFGMGQTFTYCRFVSPDMAGTLVFDNIPDASATWFVNDPDQQFITVSAFDAMTDDRLLRDLDIRSLDTGMESFAGKAPCVILFETATGRRGAVKIKGFIAEGNDSYILADIKMQKK